MPHTMINMRNDGHVTDVVFQVHNSTELFSCELHHLGKFGRSHVLNFNYETVNFKIISVTTKMKNSKHKQTNKDIKN